MASLNYCSGCKRNFASTSMHAKHRIGDVGQGTRRCMTDEEMTAIGFVMAVEPVKRLAEGREYICPMETWNIPADEKAKAYFAAMREKQVAVEDA